MNPLSSDRSPSDALGRCVHDARNALAAISSAGEVLARVEPPHELIREAGVVVQRQARHLSTRIAEILAMVQHGGEPQRLLAVSDDARLLAMLGGVLGAREWRIDFCASSEDGLRALHQREHACALVDVRTSRGGGLGLAQRARHEGFRGRLVAVWGSRLPHQHQQEDGVAGFDTLLARNFEPAALRAALEPERAG
jgi:CheY-like chemotaxis protein